ncbi:NifB/NifX family molybdenum-iron cluster-binding protein [Bacteroidota bacterium]
MKVAIPTNDGIRIISDFRKIEGFKIYEIENGTILHERFITNFTSRFFSQDDTFPNQNNKNNKPVKPIIRAIEDCKVVISNGISKELFEDLVQVEKEVYITEASDVRSAIRNFIRKKQNLEKNLF